MPGAAWVAVEEILVLAEEGAGNLGFKSWNLIKNDHDCSHTSCRQILNVLYIATCIPVLTPQGPIQYLQVLMGRLTQIECQSVT